MAIYEPTFWKDRKKDAATGEVVVKGTPLCAKNLNKIEDELVRLSTQCENCNKGITLSDIVEALGYCPTRVEQSFYSISLQPGEAWEWQEELEVYTQKVDGSVFLPEDLTSTDVRKIWFKVGYPEKTDPDIFEDFTSNVVRYREFDPQTKTITFHALGAPEYEQTLNIVGYVLYDMKPAFDSSSPVAIILNEALDSAITSGKITKEDIAALFNGHTPNRFTFKPLEFEITQDDFTRSEENGKPVRVSKELVFEYNGEVVEMSEGEGCNGPELIAFGVLSPLHESTDNGIVLKTYCTDEQFESLGAFRLPIQLVLAKTEGE